MALADGGHEREIVRQEGPEADAISDDIAERTALLIERGSALRRVCERRGLARVELGLIRAERCATGGRRHIERCRLCASGRRGYCTHAEIEEDWDVLRRRADLDLSAVLRVEVADWNVRDAPHGRAPLRTFMLIVAVCACCRLLNLFTRRHSWMSR